MPKVTVVMPAYNTEKYISKAIQSILDQTYADFEFLIIDDASTDNTVNIINSFSDPRIRLIINEKNLGLARAPNIALTEAKGELIARMDSDDIAIPDRLKIQVELFDKDPELALLGGSAYVINSNSERTGEILAPITGTDELKALLLFSNSFVHSSIMMRTHIYKKVGGYPIYIMGEDFALFYEISLHYKVDNIPDILVEYRVHNANMTTLKKQETDYFVRKLLKDKLDVLSVSYEENDLELLLTPIKNSPYSIEEYATIYSKIILGNKKMNIYPFKALGQLLLNNWYQIITEKGEKNLLKYYFRKPIYDTKLSTSKQIRRLFKKSIKNIFK